MMRFNKKRYFTLGIIAASLMVCGVDNLLALELDPTIAGLKCGVNHIEAKKPKERLVETGDYGSTAAKSIKSIHESRVAAFKRQIENLRCPRTCPEERRGRLTDSSTLNLLAAHPYDLDDPDSDEYFVDECVAQVTFADGTSEEDKRAECERRRSIGHDWIRAGASFILLQQTISCLETNVINIGGNVTLERDRDEGRAVAVIDAGVGELIASVSTSTADEADTVVDATHEQAKQLGMGLMTIISEQ